MCENGLYRYDKTILQATISLGALSRFANRPRMVKGRGWTTT